MVTAKIRTGLDFSDKRYDSLVGQANLLNLITELPAGSKIIVIATSHPIETVNDNARRAVNKALMCGVDLHYYLARDEWRTLLQECGPLLYGGTYESMRELILDYAKTDLATDELGNRCNVKAFPEDKERWLHPLLNFIMISMPSIAGEDWIGFTQVTTGTSPHPVFLRMPLELLRALRKTIVAYP